MSGIGDTSRNVRRGAVGILQQPRTHFSKAMNELKRIPIFSMDLEVVVFVNVNTNEHGDMQREIDDSPF